MKSFIEGLFMLAFGLSIRGAILAWQIVLPVIGLLWVFVIGHDARAAAVASRIPCQLDMFGGGSRMASSLTALGTA